MKTSVRAAAALFVSLSLCAVSAQARNTQHFFPVQDAIEMGKSHGLGDDIKFYFGDQRHAPVEQTLAKGIITNKKTHSANKTDQTACNWAMLSALLQLQQAARERGGNAVVNIESFYQKIPYRSNDQYECRAGNIMSGVALRGDVVKLK